MSFNLNQFTYAGRRSFDDYNMIITETPENVGAEKDISFKSVPGRSGDVIIDNGRYFNIEKKYEVTVIAEDFEMPLLAKKINHWLNSVDGYAVLSDTYDPLYYRLARYVGKVNIEDKLRIIGSTTLKFNCKPFKYSFEGQKLISVAKEDALINPEGLSSLPEIKISGTGNVTLYINNASYLIEGIDGHIEIIGDPFLARKGTELQNDKIMFPDPPILAPGENIITWTGDVTALEIKPGWCSL